MSLSHKICCQLKKLSRKQALRTSLTVLGVSALCLLMFEAGVAVGEQRHDHGLHWQEHYVTNFLGGPEASGQFASFRPMPAPEMGGHGFAGQVLMNDGENLTMTCTGGVERMVLINDRTMIKHCSDTVPANVITPEHRVTVIGAPDNDGRTVAKFIRVEPLKSCP
jgi:hypothetical protein